MRTRHLLSCLLPLAVACSGDETSSTARDAGTTDAKTDAADAADCPSTGTGTFEFSVDIDDGVAADVHLVRGEHVIEPAITASGSHQMDAGSYNVIAQRVLGEGATVGFAYQGAVEGSEGSELCLRDGKTVTVRVKYTREPGSARLWLTQSNGSGAQVMAFDADQLDSAGDQTPSVSLAPGLDNVGPIRVDGSGRLWIGSSAGKLVAYNASRLGASSTSAPDVVLDGPSVCEEVVPCGPRAMAFDEQGALWVATLTRVVKLAPSSLARSGQPSAAVTIKSPDIETPSGLAFDAEGNLWVADTAGAILKFNASHLAANLNAAADLAIFAQQPGPVMIGLGGPEGMAFDSDGNLWVGYFGGNDLVRFTKAELGRAAGKDDPRVPTTHVKVGAEALVTDLAVDAAGNLWLPGGAGDVYRIARSQLSAADPKLVRLRSAEIGTAERLFLHSVEGELFVMVDEVP